MTDLPEDTPESAARRLDKIRTPAEIDAAFDRGDPYAGTAVIRLVFSCEDFDVVASRVERALRSADFTTRERGCTAAGDMTRVFGRLSPGIYRRLRELGPKGQAEDPVSDVLTFIPFRELPRWFKLQKIRSTVMRFCYRRWSSIVDAGDFTARLAKRVAGRPRGRAGG
ncbi:hypothetical protein J5Y04_38560 [Kitasatospora sp. RG8]|uniref:hypothetical protein n=1 Tax=Kitasatospora sp. RG8 TaxID=2820815 RepID=UPI001ADF0824|nr:hypothetical protein [Kitasatospora sp. RG8]MBP0455381.1 hypothetical protein [Kitasatospora sp. RG8]